MSDRKTIPQSVRDKLLVDARHRCCLCTEHPIITNAHHIVWVRDGGANEEGNLVLVCGTCHDHVHRIPNLYTPDQLREYKRRWIEFCWPRSDTQLMQELEQAPFAPLISLAKLPVTSPDLESFFLAGCGLGNRLALIPLPPGKGDVGGLNEFIGALEKIGLADDPVMQAAVEVRDLLARPHVSTPREKKAILRFLNALPDLPEAVRSRCAPDSYRWFKFGELVYDVFTSSFLDRQSNEGRISRSVSTSVKISSLEALTGQLRIPPELREEVRNLAVAARGETEMKSLMQAANRVAQAAFDWLRASVSMRRRQTSTPRRPPSPAL